MIGVASGTARGSHLDEDGGVGALVEEIRLHCVTLSTGIPYP
jgi:hypothetical protein